jgi:hypothetical protein
MLCKMAQEWLRDAAAAALRASTQSTSLSTDAPAPSSNGDGRVRHRSVTSSVLSDVDCRSVRQQIEEAQSAIQKTGTAAALERCRLLLARINAALSGTQPAHFVNTSPVVQGALERAYVVLKKMFERSS